MYSTKQLEKILLAELTRQQYNTFMEDVVDSTDLTYKEIRNIRNSDTFRKVFGNNQIKSISIQYFRNPRQ